MPLHQRTRITLILPAPVNRDQFQLFNQILTGLVKQCGGVTASQFTPPAFNGWWINQGGKTVPDKCVLILADDPAQIDGKLLLAMERLKKACEQKFRQDLVWITLHTIQQVG